MKKKIIMTAVIVIASFSACDESFNPKIELQDEYLLTCLINCTSSYQTATVSRTFDVDGYDPSLNTSEKSVAGVEIRIWHRDTVYIMQDSIVSDAELTSDDYKYFYYINGFQPGYDEQLDIEAVLPDGRKLKSTIFTPSTRPNNYFFSQGDGIIPPAFMGEFTDEFIMYWQITQDPGISLFIPRFFINYKKDEGSFISENIIEIPVEYVNRGGTYVPVYPAGTTGLQTRFKTTAITRTMELISEGDPNKDNYTITGAFIYFSVLDETLSTYYGALQMLSDGFTVRVDAPEYTNIEGGYGIFGSYFEKYFSIVVSRSYAESFGYKWEFIID